MAENNTFKMVKIVGESSKGIEEAVESALAKSRESIHGQSWAHITDLRANLKPDGAIQAWQVSIEVGFKID